MQLTRQTAALICAGATIVMLAGAWWFGLREPPPPMPVGPRPPFRIHVMITPPTGALYDEAGEPVGVGDRFPPLKVQGWLLGPPALPPHPMGALTVIEVWNEVCPISDAAADGLRRIREKYDADGVNFVGVTAHGKLVVQAFVERHGINWPSAYGASLGGAGMQIFLLGDEGRILWRDGVFPTSVEEARQQQTVPSTTHPQITERLCRGLDQAIKRGLAHPGI